jgi:hypothetical protein
MDQLIETSTLEVIKKFSIPNEYTLYDESKLLDSLRNVISYLPLKSEKQKKDETVRYLVREWFSQKIGEKYEELSPEIFELEREIEIPKEHFIDSDGYKEYNGDGTTKVKIPMFLEAELDKDIGWKSEQYERGYRTYKLSLFSRIPIVPADMRKSGKEALALAYNIYADALTTDIISDVMFEHPDYAPHPENAKLVVLWKPKPSEIHVESEVIDRDPALVLKYDNPYLVTTWAEPDEEPFMSFIDFFKRSNVDKLVDVNENV